MRPSGLASPPVAPKAATARQAGATEQPCPKPTHAPYLSGAAAVCFALLSPPLPAQQAPAQPLVDAAPTATSTPAAAAAPHGELPQAVAALLPELTLEPSQVSAYVRRVDAERPLLAVDAEHPRVPASTIKLVTSIAALDLLGPEYRWHTEVLIEEDVIAGTLEGDLSIKGYGDPFLGTESFAALIRAVRAKGIRHIAGDVIFDNSHLVAPTAARGDFDGAAQRSYNALPAALSLNRQVTDIVLYNDHVRGGVGVYTDPPLSYLDIDNDAQVVQAPCRGRYHRLSVRFSTAGGTDEAPPAGGADTSETGAPGAGDIAPPEPAPAETPVLPTPADETPTAAGGTPAAPRLTISGNFASECADERIPRLLLSPEQHVAAAFDALWREAGGTIRGGLLAAAAPANAEVFHRTDSEPLHALLRRVNKWSDNLMARMIFLTLGTAHAGPPGSEEKARTAFDAWLTERGFSFPGLVIDNGSGLSRQTRIAAASLGELLTWAYHQPWMPELMGSMAIMGVDGTLANRMQSEPIAGRAHMKTGTVRDASCIAGYVLDPDGQRWVVVVLVNALPGQRLAAWHGHAVHHALLRWLFDGADLP